MREESLSFAPGNRWRSWCACHHLPALLLQPWDKTLAPLQHCPLLRDPRAAPSAPGTRLPKRRELNDANSRLQGWGGHRLPRGWREAVGAVPAGNPPVLPVLPRDHQPHHATPCRAVPCHAVLCR